ncbi:MAG TPA: lysophospholipid acyltransferase family protein [Chloroflexota bacterium]|nr:lysophospholipid acyltransferase family protein [Chloroflexota bacterium]
MIAYLLIQLATWLTRVLPLGVQLRLADAIAAIGWRVLPAMHRRVRDNVRVVLGPDASPSDVERVARAQWRNYLRYMRDFAALPHDAGQEMERIFSVVEGWEHVEQALARGRGAALVSVHFGNWDLAAGTLAQRYPVSAIADTFSSARVDAAINQRRHALGLRTIPVDKALKRTISAFRRNEFVAFLVDKPVPGDEGIGVEFFGRPVRIPAGAAYFAQRMGAPLLMGFVWRNEDRTFSAKLLPPLEPEEDVRLTMERIVSLAENQIRAYPEHWYMFRSMFPSDVKLRGTALPLASSLSLPTTRKEAVA